MFRHGPRELRPRWEVAPRKAQVASDAQLISNLDKIKSVKYKSMVNLETVDTLWMATPAYLIC
jgi:hypothetical protein